MRYLILLEETRYPKSWKLAPTVLYWRSIEKNAFADFLIHVLTNDPERSEYFSQSPLKGIRTNFFITDISKTSISDINAGDNGAYVKSRNITKFSYCDNDQTNIIRPRILIKKFTSHRIRS